MYKVGIRIGISTVVAMMITAIIAPITVRIIIGIGMIAVLP